MENPILQMLSQSKPLSRQANNGLIAMLQNASNPQELMQNLVSQNPQIMDLVNKYGNGDPEAAFYEYARRTGRNPEEILNILKKFMK